MSQAQQLSMGACAYCRTQLWRDMPTWLLRKHFSGNCPQPPKPDEPESDPWTQEELF